MEREMMVRLGSGISLLVGLWLIWVNFLVGLPGTVDAPWNHGITGLVVALIAGFRLARPAQFVALSWMNMVLGIWLIASPFVFGYAGVFEIVRNDVIAGIVLIAASGLSAFSSPPARRLP
jgi:hypothetical protein